MFVFQKDKYPLVAAHSVYPVVRILHELPSLKQYFIDPAGNSQLFFTTLQAAKKCFSPGILYGSDMAKYLSWYIVGDLSCAKAVLQNEHVSQAALSKFQQVVQTHKLQELSNKQKLEVDQWRASDNECSRKMEKSFMDWRAHLMFTPREMLVGLKKTKLFIYSCEYDVLRDDSFLFAKLLGSMSIGVNHEHVESCYHGCMFDDNDGTASLMDKFYKNIKQSLA